MVGTKFFLMQYSQLPLGALALKFDKHRFHNITRAVKNKIFVFILAVLNGQNCTVHLQELLDHGNQGHEAPGAQCLC